MPRYIESVTRRIEGRLAAAAIVGFLMFSLAFGLATIFAGRSAHALPPPVSENAEVLAAELDVREMVDNRIAVHLKRLNGLANAR